MRGGKQGFLAAHPVGDYWWTSSDVDPNVEYGGVWEKVTDRFIYASGSKSVGATGGSETVALTVSQIPSHSHSVRVHNANYSNSNIAGAGNNPGYNGSVSTTATGGGQPHDNMPPYVVANCWHRTE